MLMLHYLINDQIPFNEIHLYNVKNVPLGIFTLDHALKLADDYCTDLVLIEPNVTPPICILATYSKFLLNSVNKKELQNT